MSNFGHAQNYLEIKGSLKIEKHLSDTNRPCNNKDGNEGEAYVFVEKSVDSLVEFPNPGVIYTIYFERDSVVNKAYMEY